MPPLPPKYRKPFPDRPESKEPDSLGQWDTKYALLSSTLQLAVPLWIDQLRGRGWDYVQQRAQECGNYVAEHGDLILFKGKKKGETAEAFNRLAEGVACLSFCPGGVTLFGSHWESCLEEDISARSANVMGRLLKALSEALKLPGV